MSFAQVQANFVAHIKDPDNVPSPTGIEDRRMKIYRELFFNNIENFVASAFPVLKSLYLPEDWQKLVRQFFIEHDCKSPYFLEISQEFLSYLELSYTKKPHDPSFMYELAHYEWVELDVSICERSESESTRQSPLALDTALFLSSTARCVHYDYPVHQIKPDFQPTNPDGGPYCFIVYRDFDEETQFISVNPLTTMLLDAITQTPGICITELSHSISEQIPQFTAEQLAIGAQQTLQQFVELGIIVEKTPNSTLSTI
ncbi:putative DNA-binding domain-containing protein [Pseudoalteromonas luteoviolacea]|uniref:HvfC family RiPP maturation protein n=1 Tax=Pseudoalteromonas luteoviolacea TaxID=43657 RepID=UPI001B39107B|nr:putative DNA-binding domain-containing protein [Pseudoalteromonas luteoviolacea]MBQ4814100.1 putative DNA-binding domain-containing protein [Pseudoalteromonas luteoviolacea]